MMILFTCD